MPRYFFHIRDGEDLIADEEGTELPDIEAAKAEAVANARDLATDEIRAKRAVDGRVIEVADRTGRTLTVIAIRSAI